MDADTPAFFSYQSTPDLLPFATLSEHYYSQSVVNEFRAEVARGSICETFQLLRSATPYVRSTVQSTQLKIVTMAFDDWDGIPSGDQIRRRLYELSNLISRLEGIQQFPGIDFSWVDPEHLILNFGAVLDSAGILRPNPDVSVAAGVPEVVKFAEDLHVLLGDLSGLVMPALTSPAYVDFCRRRKQAFNTPMPGSTIQSNSFHNAYELCSNVSRLPVFSRPVPFSECPLSYSMHIHLPFASAPSPHEVLIFDGLRTYIPLQDFQVTVFHSVEPFSYAALALDPLDEGPRALNIFARAFDAVINGRVRAQGDDVTSEDLLLTNQQPVLGGSVNYSAFIMLESFMELKLVQRRIGIELPFDEAERALISRFDSDVCDQCSSFFEGMNYAAHLSNEISLAKAHALFACPMSSPPLELSQTPDAIDFRTHRPRIIGTSYDGESSDPDEVPQPSLPLSNSESCAPPTPTPSNKRKHPSRGPRGRKKTAVDKNVQTQQIVDGIIALYEKTCSLDNIRGFIKVLSHTATMAVDVRNNVWRECKVAMGKVPDAHELQSADPDTVCDVFSRLGSAIAALTETHSQISTQLMAWRLSVATLVIESLNKLNQSDEHFLHEQAPASAVPGGLADQSTTAKIRRSIDHFFHQSTNSSSSTTLTFTLQPAEVLDQPDPTYHYAVSLSGPSSTVRGKPNTIARNKVRLEKQILFTMFLRNGMVRFINGTVGPRKSAPNDPHARPRAQNNTHNHKQDPVDKDSKDRLFFCKPECKMAKEVSKWGLFYEICKAIRESSVEKPNLHSYFMLEPLFKVCFYEVYTYAFTPDVITGVCQRIKSSEFTERNALLSQYAYLLIQRVGGGIFSDDMSSLQEPGLSRLAIKPSPFQPLLVATPVGIPCLQLFPPSKDIERQSVADYGLGPMEQLLFPGLYSCFQYGEHLRNPPKSTPSVNENFPPEILLTRRALGDPHILEHIQPLRKHCPAFQSFLQNPQVNSMVKALEVEDGAQAPLLKALCIWRVCAPTDDILFSKLVSAPDNAISERILRKTFDNELYPLNEFKIPDDPKFRIPRTHLSSLFRGFADFEERCVALANDSLSFSHLLQCFDSIPELAGTATALTICFDAVELDLIQPPTVVNLVEYLYQNDIFPRAFHGLQLLMSHSDFCSTSSVVSTDVLADYFERLITALAALLPQTAIEPFQDPTIRSLGMQDIIAALSSISWQAQYMQDSSEEIPAGSLAS